MISSSAHEHGDSMRLVAVLAAEFHVLDLFLHIFKARGEGNVLKQRFVCRVLFTVAVAAAHSQLGWRDGLALLAEAIEVVESIIIVAAGDLPK